MEGLLTLRITKNQAALNARGRCEAMKGKNIISHLAAVSLVLLFLCFGAAVPSFAVSPSNSGLTGLWEYPTAELPGDGCGFIHYEDFYPYRSGGVSLGLFPCLEFNLRVNEFENGIKISDNYGRYKDKAADVKLLLSGQREAAADFMRLHLRDAAREKSSAR